MSHYRWALLALSSILNVVFVVPYAYEIVKGKVRPNRVSWLLWLVLGAASLLAVLKAGGRREAVFNLFFVIGEGIVFLLSLFKGETAIALATGSGAPALRMPPPATASPRSGAMRSASPTH